VGAVLEGSVRKAGGRVRISAQLINAADGFHLWAERYDRTLEDVFAVQEEIASSIAEALRVALRPGEAGNLVKDRPNDARAYDLYLQGRAQYGRYSAESLRRALDLFQQAIAVDPGYALAWAGIADCYGQMNQWGGAEEGWDLNRLGLEAARRAIALNPKLAEAHKAEALVLRFAGDHEGMRAALGRAVEANPRFIPALTNLAVDAFTRADLAGAERLLRRAIEVDPQDAFAHGWLSMLLGFTSRGDEAIAMTNRQQQLSTDTFYLGWAHASRAWIHLRRNEDTQAEQVLRDGLAAGAEPANLRAIEALLLARAGRVEEASRIVEEAETSTRLGGGGVMTLASASVRLGQIERAQRILARTLMRDLAPCSVRLEPALHSLVDLPPFAPRRWDAALVWPLEAPMIDAARHALFREVRIESGLPHGSDVRVPTGTRP
jgi:tetratricopeptide (TPR) repeat protein